MLDLNDRVAIVTGAARGIGAVIARLLAEQGATVAVADMNTVGAENTARQISSAGFSAMSVEVDVAGEASIANMIQSVIKEYGKIDILVNNAGVNNNAPIPEMKLEEWDRIININLRGTQLCSKEAIKEMVKRRYGRIINIASMAGQIGGLKVSPDYTAAKAGILGLTKAYARYGAKYGINVNAVSPGFIETDMTKGRDDPNSVPVGRLGTPEDVAKAVYFLASPLSDYITGTTLDVNGGLLMR